MERLENRRPIDRQFSTVQITSVRLNRYVGRGVEIDEGNVTGISFARIGERCVEFGKFSRLISFGFRGSWGESRR